MLERQDLYFTDFDKKHPELGNLFEVEITVQGKTYRSLEHLYQSLRFIQGSGTMRQHEFIERLNRLSPEEAREMANAHSN